MRGVRGLAQILGNEAVPAGAARGLDSPFLARVRVQVPEAGALLRWLLGLGDNIEVVAPAGLRLVMREQMAKAVRHYEEAGGLGVAAG
ncbi:MAG: WYL domain-containing protein [Gammaproteobacteria bacterium]|jgi:predicted DNA-binding transcriptional regulator YafY|nr:WYL domain-containing protein [Gammaproteobacteria bacterium]